MKEQKAIYVEYEIPPLRAVYHRYFEDDGQTDDEVREEFQSTDNGLRVRILKVDRRTITDNPDEDDGIWH